MTNKTNFKHVGLLNRKDSQTFEEFVEYWVHVHTKIALKVPGLRGYVINPIDRKMYPDSPIDGFSELWFDSLEAAEAAFSSPEGMAAYDDCKNFIGKLAVTNINEIKVK